MLSLSKHTTLIDSSILQMGFNDAGILFIVYKKTSQRTLEETKQAMQEAKRLTGNRKVCILADVTYIGETNREIRNYTAEELPKIAKAVALISDSPLGKMVVNLFFSLKPQPFPVKMFDDQCAATEWLLKHL